MSKLWNSHYSQFPEDQTCVIQGEHCTGAAIEGHHGLHGRRDGDPEIKQHVDNILNFVPSCHECNFLRHADNEWEQSFDWLVDRHGIQRIAEWAGEFPEHVKRAGTEWTEMMNRLIVYRV